MNAALAVSLCELEKNLSSGNGEERQHHGHDWEEEESAETRTYTLLSFRRDLPAEPSGIFTVSLYQLYLIQSDCVCVDDLSGSRLVRLASWPASAERPALVPSSGGPGEVNPRRGMARIDSDSLPEESTAIHTKPSRIYFAF
ncbi:uncharacterized protein V6R79_017036 [Siganus canaliculatus]